MCYGGTMRSSWRSWCWMFGSVAGVLWLDLLTKSWAAFSFQTEPWRLTSWFEFTYSENPGIALGIPLQGWPVLALTAFLMIGFLIYAVLALDLNRWPVKIAVSLILAGGLGNFYDRLTLGIVRDFLHFEGWHVFNVADAALSIGVGLLLLSSFGTLSQKSSHAL